MEHGPFIGDLPITTVIFHSYVSLPAGIWKDHEKSLAHPTTHLLDHQIQWIGWKGYRNNILREKQWFPVKIFPPIYWQIDYICSLISIIKWGSKAWSPHIPGENDWWITLQLFMNILGENLFWYFLPPISRRITRYMNIPDLDDQMLKKNTYPIQTYTNQEPKINVLSWARNKTQQSLKIIWHFKQHLPKKQVEM